MKREFTISAAWSTGASFLEQGANALTFLIIARLIGVENFGVAAMAFAFLFLGEFLVRDTITEAIVAGPALETGRLEATFVALIAFALAIIGILGVISLAAAAAYGQPQVAPLLMTASPTVLMISAAGVPTALLRRKLAYRTLAIRSVAGVVGGGVVGVVMALKGFGAWSLVAQRLTDIGINSIVAFTAAGWRPRRWPTRAEFALLRGLAPQVVLLRSITLVINQTPTVALGIFADPRAAGLYAFAWRLVEIVNALIVKPMQGVAQSALAAMRRERASTSQFYLDLTEVAALAGFAAFAGLALIADPIVVVLLGAEWQAAEAILPFLCIAGAISALAAIQEAYLLAIDRLGRLVAACFLEALIGIAIVSWASLYGPVVAAAAIAIRAAAALPLRTAAALRHEGIPSAHFFRILLAPALMAVGMATAVGVWRALALGRVPDPIFVASAILVGMVSFCGLLLGATPRTVARLRTFIEAKR